MKKKQLTAMFLLTAVLTGCSSMGNTEGNLEESKTEAETDAEADVEAEAGETEAGAEGEAGDAEAEDAGTSAGGAVDKSVMENVSGDGEERQIALQGEITQGRILLEDEEAFYICGTERIRRIEKDGSASRILWEKGEDAREPLIVMEGRGVLLGDSIYFLEEAQGEMDGLTGVYGRCLSAVRTDGTEYRRITELEDFPQAFYYCGDALYLESNGSVKRCPVTKDGSFASPEEVEEISFEGLPGEYSPVLAMRSGSRYVSALESLHTFGYYLAENEKIEVVAIDPETGEERKLMPDGRFRSFNRDYFLLGKYGEGQEELYLVDTESFETSLLAVYENENYPGGIRVLDMDEEYVYVVAENAGDSKKKDFQEENDIYEEINLKTKERRELFRLGKKPGLKGDFYFYAGSVIFQEGYAYYADEKDYKLFLARRSLKEPGEVQILGDAFYDSGISRVGTVESYFEEIHSETRPEFVLEEIDLERLVVDERYQGAEKINRVLTAYQDSIISYGKDPEDIKWREEEIAAWEGDDIPYSLSYSYSSYPSRITYFDGERFSFYQQDYDYTGGAHGMPFWVGFTFDLNTGERLLLSDVIENSEEELKEIVTRYFEDYMSQTPDGFWEDALTTVKDGTDFSSDFYLTEEGICFYFEPYALACYAAGFQQVTIPYEEFELKIPVKG